MRFVTGLLLTLAVTHANAFFLNFLLCSKTIEITTKEGLLFLPLEMQDSKIDLARSFSANLLKLKIKTKRRNIIQITPDKQEKILADIERLTKKELQ